MEDRVHIEHVRSANGRQDYTYLAVYDGHGGADASEFVRKNLLGNIQKQEGFNRSDEEMLEAIRKGFIETHYAMLEVVDAWPLTASGYTSTAGTTASVAFIVRGKIFTGHVGDSAIIVGKKHEDSISGISLTVDHKPDNLDEEERISKAGGMVMRKSGVMRVVWTRPLKGHIGPVRRSTPTESIAFLAVARSLGDLWSYNKETKQFIVSPEPDVSVYLLDQNDICLVLGSDGLTNVLKPQQVVDVVCTAEMNTDFSSGQLVNHSRVLLRTALDGWGTLRADNITVITVMFDNPDCNLVHNSLYETISQNSACSMDLDQLFTENHTALVRITEKCCQQFSTVPVDIVYTGALDQQFTSDICYRGPGFSKQIAHDNPIVPAKNSNIFTHLLRSASYSGILTGSLREPSFCPANYCVPVPLEETGACKVEASCSGEQNANTNSDKQSREFVYAELTPANPDEYDLTNNSIVSTSLVKSHDAFPVQGTVHSFSVNEDFESDVKLKSVNEDVMKTNSAAGVYESANNRDLKMSPGNEQKTTLRVSGHTSPISKPIAVVMPFETTPKSSDRKRLIPLRRVRNSFLKRRGAVRRNLVSTEEFASCSTKEDGDSCFATEGETDLKENGDFWSGDDTEESCSDDTTLIKRKSKSSLGGASALSPMLMLAALRTPDQLLLAQRSNDPLRKELVSYKCMQYCSSTGAAAKSKFGKLKLDDTSTSGSTSALDASYVAQKRKARTDDSRSAAIEPASKRSRFWGFFSSLIGERKVK